MDTNSFISVTNLIGTIAIALATIALWRVTETLATETKRMADATGQPQIICSLMPNPWALIYLDIVIENTGNATAFDIVVKIDPEPVLDDQRDERPLSSISVLKPGEKLASFLGATRDNIETVFNVQISWKLAPDAASRQSLDYKLDMNFMKQMTILGAANPQVQIAEQVKHIRDDWRSVLQGHRKLEVKTFSIEDREAERRTVIDRVRPQTQGHLTNKLKERSAKFQRLFNTRR